MTNSTSAIRAEGLTKRYGATLALDSLNLTVAEGEVYGYLGPNGAGKTTTIRLLLGLHRPTDGRAELFGVDAWRDPVRAHTRVAYVAGEPFLWPSLTGDETLEFLARLHGGTDVAYRDQLVKRFQLDTRKKIRALSKGNRQKVQLIAALATRADLLLLDEPTSGLDPLMKMAFRESVSEAKERGQTAFLSSHILSEVEATCDRVGILREGRLVDEGTLEGLRHLSAQTVEVTFAGDAPYARATSRRRGRKRRTQHAALRGHRRGRPADLRARRAPDRHPHQPPALARGDLPAPLRVLRRPCRPLAPPPDPRRRRASVPPLR
jgi:ABC-2 type transport system ATP-binding protein